MSHHRGQDKSDRNVTFRKWYWLVTIGVFAYMAWLSYYHWGQLNVPILRTPVIVVSFIWLAVILTAAHFNRAYSKPAGAHKVMAVVPNHNEDPTMFRQMLESLAAQTYPIHVLYIVENGSTNGKCRDVFDEWSQTQRTIAHAIMVHDPKPSKRNAQGVAFKSPEFTMCDVVVTIDGDTELAPNAIQHGLQPFRDPSVMSVAGLLIAKNRAHNWLTKLVDLGFVSSFMNGRAAWSTFRSVAVNCGGLAFYRSWIVTVHLTDYLNQKLCGREVNSGDDRILTGYAAMHGKTVFQETSVAYTLLPNNMSHLTRQRGRWWRSFWWGGIWLIRSFSPARAIWWLVMSQYITFVLYAAMIPLILIVDPIRTMHFPWEFFVYIAGLSYIRMARTLKVKRPDQSTLNQIIVYIIGSPFVTILNLWLCTVLQFWGAITFRETGWRTRHTVEVGVDK